MDIQWQLLKECAEGNLIQVAFLINKGEVDPSLCVQGITPLLVASSYGQIEVVKLLLSFEKVDPSIFSNMTIRWAEENGKSDIVELLMKDPRCISAQKEIYSLDEEERDHLYQETCITEYRMFLSNAIRKGYATDFDHFMYGI